MFRAFLCVAIGLMVCADVALAKGKGGGKGNQAKAVSGKIKSVAADTGTLTVTVKNKQGSSEKTFTVSDATKVTIIAADGTKTQLTGKDGLKDPAVHENAHVKVTADAGGTVKKVEVGHAKSKKKKK